MSKKPVSPLRQRLIDDITARRFSEDTKRDYVRNVRKFAAFLGRSPDTAASEDLRRYPNASRLRVECRLMSHQREIEVRLAALPILEGR
jgi:hypothetical protein